MVLTRFTRKHGDCPWCFVSLTQGFRVFARPYEPLTPFFPGWNMTTLAALHQQKHSNLVDFRWLQNEEA